MMKYTYLLIDFFTVLIPFAFSFHPKIQFNKHFKTFWYANLIIASIFIMWDVWFTSQGVWSFSKKYTIGITLFNLPIEEVLFFICIPFSCVFTFFCLTKFYSLQWNNRLSKLTTLSVSFGLLTIGIINLDRAYTMFTFISCSIILVALQYYFKVNWLTKFYSIYPLLLIPFFIVNGLLTGTGLNEPVVWYNNDENLSLRLLTIPIEDVVYGFELLVLNIFLFEYFKAKSTTPKLAFASALTICVFLSTMITNSVAASQPIKPVSFVDLNKYAGKWFEIASFPQSFQRGCHCTTAEYTLTDRGFVVVENRCNRDSVTGKQSYIKGKAFVESNSGNAKLKVQFFWPFKAKYWIIDLADDYSYAVVSHPNKKYLWILSRTSKMDETTYQKILLRLKNMGFDLSKLQRTVQV